MEGEIHASRWALLLLGSDPQLVASDQPSIDGLLDPCAHLPLVAVVGGAVQMAVTYFYCANYCGGAHVLGHLPHA